MNGSVNQNKDFTKYLYLKYGPKTKNFKKNKFNNNTPYGHPQIM